jgi:hypothetical protein
VVKGDRPVNSWQVTAVVLFVLSTVFGLISNFVLFAIIGEVNRKLPDEQQISYLGWHLAKYMRTIGEYRRLYPGGRLVQYHFGFFALAMSLFLAFGWVFFTQLPRYKGL